MGGMIAINRSISPDVQDYILKERDRKVFINWCIGTGMVSLFLCFFLQTFIVPVIAVAVLICIYLWKKKGSEKLYSLLKTGILTKTSLKYISYKEKVVNKRGKKIFIYFYELRYFDLNEKLHISKVSFREMLPDEMLHDIPLIFSAANPKKAIIFHEKFKNLKKTKKGLFKESRVQIIDGKFYLKGYKYKSVK